MERRLILHDKFKEIKLSKMTVKQGEKNVTLNLKKDIMDPNVEISDKVLFMLETYIERQQQLKSQQVADKKNEQEKQIQTVVTQSPEKNLTEISCQPSSSPSPSSVSPSPFSNMTRIGELSSTDSSSLSSSSNNTNNNGKHCRTEDKSSDSLLPVSKRVRFDLNENPIHSKNNDLNTDAYHLGPIKKILKNTSNYQTESNNANNNNTNNSIFKSDSFNIDYKLSTTTTTTTTPQQSENLKTVDSNSFVNKMDENNIESTNDESVVEENQSPVKSNSAETNTSTSSSSSSSSNNNESSDIDMKKSNQEEDPTTISTNTTNTSTDSINKTNSNEDSTESNEIIAKTACLNISNEINESISSNLDSSDLNLNEKNQNRNESNLNETEINTTNVEQSLNEIEKPPPPPPQPPTQMPQPPKMVNTKATKIEKPAHEPTLFSCRLCRLKFSNQRALHEHVARIHGGKCGTFNLSSMSKSDECAISDTDYDQDEYNDDENDDDDDDDDETNSSSNSFDQFNNTTNNKLAQTKKFSLNKKLHHTKFKKSLKKYSPHPNVAIRVAKVAYYNSKLAATSHANSSSSSSGGGGSTINNAFKSSIFTNGGLRGNFFSQERLPLRSCKIKMKLNSNDPNERQERLNNSNDPNDLLSYSNFISNLETIDKNTTISTQSIHFKQQETLTDNQIKLFFKSLLSYIPIQNVMRLDDLIKLNESWLCNESEHLVECVRLIHEIILDAKQFGLSLFKLKKIFQEKFYSNDDKSGEKSNNSNRGKKHFKMSLFKRLIQLLLDNYLVLAVGVVERVYVAHEFKQHWVIQSCKNQKGRGYYESSSKYLNEDSSDLSDCVEENKNNEENSNGSNKEGEEEDGADDNERITTRLSSSKSNESLDVFPKPSTTNWNESTTTMNRQFKPVCLVPRPWRYIDGLLNRPVLQKMFETILIYLKSYPNSTLESVCSHFSPVLQPIMTLELLEMLESLKCVEKTVLRPEQECNLFSNFNNGSERVVNYEDDLDGNEIFCYHLTQNSIFLIKKVFP